MSKNNKTKKGGSGRSSDIEDAKRSFNLASASAASASEEEFSYEVKVLVNAIRERELRFGYMRVPDGPLDPLKDITELPLRARGSDSKIQSKPS